MENSILSELMGIAQEKMVQGDYEFVKDLLTNSKTKLYLESITPNITSKIFIKSSNITSCMQSAIQAGIPSTLVYNYSLKYIEDIYDHNEVEDIINIILQYAKWIHDYMESNDLQLSFKVNRYISEHLYEKIVITDMTKRFNVSEATLHTKYKKETGYTIYQTILSKKMKHARYLLEYTNMDISSISFQLGYSSQSHFTDKFRSYYGITPKQLRIQKNTAI